MKKTRGTVCATLVSLVLNAHTCGLQDVSNSPRLKHCLMFALKRNVHSGLQIKHSGPFIQARWASVNISGNISRCCQIAIVAKQFDGWSQAHEPRPISGHVRNHDWELLFRGGLKVCELPNIHRYVRQVPRSFSHNSKNAFHISASLTTITFIYWQPPYYGVLPHFKARYNWHISLKFGTRLDPMKCVK